MSRRNPILHGAPIALFSIFLTVFLILMIRYQRKPVIHSIDRIVAATGDNIELTGDHFGDEIEGARLIVGSQPLSSAGIIEWQDSRILARVPRLAGAVLIKVKNRSGFSNGIVLGDAARFPEVEYGSWLPGRPFIEFVDPGIAAPGTLVTLLGKGFGERKSDSCIWVNQSDTSVSFRQEDPDSRQYIQVASYDLWSESIIRFWMPPNSASGYIYVKKGRNFSNPIHFERLQGSGEFEIGPLVFWSLRQEVIISGIGAFPGNSLYLRFPVPVDDGLGQRAAVVFKEDGGSNVIKLHREGSLDVFRLNEFTSGEQRSISRQILVSTAAIKAQVNPNGLVPYDPTNPDLKASLGIDEWIRPDLVAGTAARIIGTFNDDWRKARAIYDYVIEKLDWIDEVSGYSDYLATPQVASDGYSFLFCSLARAAKIPARPISGLLIEMEEESRRWWWAEIWIEGLGWVPVDPACGDLAPYPAWLATIDNPKEYYFGGLDERHIAFSRGIAKSVVHQPGSESRIPSEPYSLQEIWEEISGNLHAYTSEWSTPWVTAMYR